VINNRNGIYNSILTAQEQQQ